MFNWFKPKIKEVEYAQQALAEAQQKDPNTYYSIGLTNSKQISIKIGVSTLTMNKSACEKFLQHVKVFMDTLPDDEETDDQPKT